MVSGITIGRKGCASARHWRCPSLGHSQSKSRASLATTVMVTTTSTRLESPGNTAGAAVCDGRRSLSSQPGACGRKLVWWKESYRRAAKSRASKSESLYFPARLRHDGNLCDLTAMRNHEIEIIPIHPALPTFKLISNNEHTRFRSTVDPARNVSLVSREFTLFQGAAKAEHINVVRFIFDS